MSDWFKVGRTTLGGELHDIYVLRAGDSTAPTISDKVVSDIVIGGVTAKLDGYGYATANHRRVWSHHDDILLPATIDSYDSPNTAITVAAIKAIWAAAILANGNVSLANLNTIMALPAVAPP